MSAFALVLRYFVFQEFFLLNEYLLFVGKALSTILTVVAE